ncbi:5-hydroxytryptamine receptor 3A-like isoform X2 [Sander lucioperca]|uniref:5-hydroxytryptamine receptor 3A-like isoform X2 n=1 Tax=Sander lucioperca TaxID=283035 RepID=UPI0016534677|nr:5-hydroxytryptamine receptor 3A-like isoform X2 [Sander lucioperca]
MSALRTLAVLALIGVSSSQTSDCSYIGLLEHLNLTTTNDLLAIVRPVKYWNKTTFVQIDMLLCGILQVDEKSQTFTSHIWTRMHWINEFLTWNSSDFCGINMLTIPRSMLWIPDMHIQEDTSDAGSIQESPFVSLSPSGMVLANTRQLLTSTCQMNLTLFPFDMQHCNITFSSMNSQANTITLGTVYNDTVLTQISEQIMVTQGEWQLIHMDIVSMSFYKGVGNKLIYRVTLCRKPMLYVINLIVPLLYFLVLDLATFFISEARGEKLSFKVTVLLSISVLLLILKDMLPSTEDRLPMIARYCVTIFAMVGLSILETMLVSFLIDLNGCCGNKAQSSVNAQVDIQLEADNHKEPGGAEETPEKSSFPLDQPDDRDLLKLILEEVKAARQEAEGQDKTKIKPGHYRRLAQIIDSVFFTLYLVAVAVFLRHMYSVWVSQYINSN